MRTLALLLALSSCALAQPTATPPKLTAKDESDIRTAIEERAKKDNQKSIGPVWSERGPLIYHVGKIEATTMDVATVEAEGVRTGTYSQRRQYVFIVTRANGQWNVARRLQVCEGPPPVRMQPLAESPQSSERGSSGCPN